MEAKSVCRIIYIISAKIFTLGSVSSPNRTPKGNGYVCAEMQMSIAMDEQRSRCIFLVCWGSTNNNYSSPLGE